MAVYAAHLTRTSQGPPSIFTIMAQEALAQSIKPALQKLVEYLEAVSPGRYRFALRWYDELYLLFDYCLQYHYLKHFAASFSEKFYGLVREPTSPSSEFSSGQRLPATQEWLSLAGLVLVPYLRDRIARVVDRWRENDEDGRLGKDKTSNLKRTTIKLSQIFSCVWWSVRLCRICLYISSGSTCPGAPPGVRLANRGAGDEDQLDWGQVGRQILKGDFSVLSFPLVSELALAAAQGAGLVVQLLRWRLSTSAATGAATSAALPPPPPPMRDERSLRWKNKCPICLQKWKTPTALPVSGYVFCYLCISRHVRNKRACPVTSLPTTEQTLVRLYIDD